VVDYVGSTGYVGSVGSVDRESQLWVVSTPGGIGGNTGQRMGSLDSASVSRPQSWPIGMP